MSTRQEVYDQVHRECASLLVISGNAEKPKFIGKLAARELLRNISAHAGGQGVGDSSQILKSDVEKAGLDAARWDEATKTNLLKKYGEGAGTKYELPNLIQVEEHVVPTTLVAQLQYFAGSVKAVSAMTAANRRQR